MPKTKKLKVVKDVKEAAKKLLKLDEKGNFCLIGGLEHLGYKQRLLDDTLPIDDVSISANSKRVFH